MLFSTDVHFDRFLGFAGKIGKVVLGAYPEFNGYRLADSG